MLLVSLLRARTRAWSAVRAEGGVAAGGMTMLCAFSSVLIFSRVRCIAVRLLSNSTARGSAARAAHR
jgi:hypothetical protein